MVDDYHHGLPLVIIALIGAWYIEHKNSIVLQEHSSFLHDLNNDIESYRIRIRDEPVEGKTIYQQNVTTALSQAFEETRDCFDLEKMSHYRMLSPSKYMIECINRIGTVYFGSDYLKESFSELGTLLNRSKENIITDIQKREFW